MADDTLQISRHCLLNRRMRISGFNTEIPAGENRPPVTAIAACVVTRPLRWQGVGHGAGSQWRERSCPESVQSVKPGRLPPLILRSNK